MSCVTCTGLIQKSIVHWSLFCTYFMTLLWLPLTYRWSILGLLVLSSAKVTGEAFLHRQPSESTKLMNVPDFCFSIHGSCHNLTGHTWKKKSQNQSKTWRGTSTRPFTVEWRVCLCVSCHKALQIGSSWPNYLKWTL